MRAVRAEVLVAYQSYVDAAPEVGELDEAPLTDLQKEATVWLPLAWAGPQW